MSELRLNAGAAAGALAPREYHLAHEPHPENGTALGFWLYLMSDCLIFAALFATYGVLGRSYAAGPTGAQLFDLTLVAINTAFLLLSSITFGFAMLRKQQKDVNGTLLWLAITGLFGLCFLGLELYEFYHLIHQGAAIAVGYQGRAMAGETGAIVLAYRNDDGEIIHIRASKVGDNGIKAGVWYSLSEDGEFVEAEF